MLHKFSLHAQLEEVERELILRAEVYPRQVRCGRLRASVAEYQVARLKAVKRTLQWLMANELDLRAYVQAQSEKRAAAAGGREDAA